jgi:PAS domain S-box-containing protein
MNIPSSITDAVEGLQDAAFLVGDDGMIVAVNSAAVKMFGYSTSQLVGSQVDELMPESARGYHKNVRAHAVEDRKPRSFTSGKTFECVRNDGVLFQADINLSPTSVDGVPLTWALVRDLDGPTEANTGRNQAMAALDAIGHMAASTFDLQKDFAVVADRLKEVVPHDRIAVMLVKDDDPSLAEVLFVAGDVHPEFPVGTEFEISDSALSWVQKSRLPVVFNRKQIEYAPPGIQKGLESGFTEMFGAPLKDVDAVVGMVMVATKNQRKFSELHKNLVIRMADHLAVAVANRKMRAVVEEQANVIELVSEIGRIVSSSDDFGDAFSRASTSFKSFVDFDRLSIFTIDPNDRMISGAFELGETFPRFGERKYSIDDDLYAELITLDESGQPRVIEFDASKSDSNFQEWGRDLIDAGYRHVLAVQLVIIQETIGLMFLASKRSRAYSEFEVSMAARIGAQISGPLRTSFHSEIEKKEAEIESVLVEIAEVVGSTLDLQSAEPKLNPLFRKLIASKSVLVAGLTEDQEALRMFYVDYSGVPEEQGLTPDASLNSLHPVKGTTTETVLKTRKSLFVNAESGSDFAKKYPGAGTSHVSGDLRSVMNVPLVANDEVFGVLGFRTNDPAGYGDRDLALAEKIANQLASSVALIELRRRDAVLAAERSVLISIGSTMGSAEDLTDVWDDFARSVSTLVPFSHIALTGVNRSEETVHIIQDSLSTDIRKFGRAAGASFGLEGTVSQALVERRSGFIESDLTPAVWTAKFPNSHPSMAKNPIRSMIGVPLIWGDEVVACLFVHSIEPNAYSEAELSVIERVAAQIAGPVAGSILRSRDAEVADQQETLTRIGSLLGASTDLAEVWDEFGRILKEILEFDRCVVVGVDNESELANVLHDSVPEVNQGREQGLKTEEESYDLKGTVSGHIAETGTSVILNQDSPNQLLKRFTGVADQGFKLPFLSNLGVPLIRGGNVVATIFFSSRERNVYSAAELSIGERVAAQISGPVAGAIVRQQELELVTERQRRVAAELEAATLAELNETKSNFVGAMSHELKTPLTSIVAFSDILTRSNEKGLEGRPLQQMRVIQRNARHLEGMINELLDLSRMESGRFEISKAPFDFAGLVNESLESSQPQFEAMKQTVLFEIAVDVLLVNGDRERLLQVVNNLLNNASKYSPEESDIEIGVKEIDRWLVVEVSDRGPGIPEDNPEGLFEMFHRADNETTRRVAGTGIGLHVSKRIVDEHGGEISLNPREGGGAVAIFRIPVGVSALS